MTPEELARQAQEKLQQRQRRSIKKKRSKATPKPTFNPISATQRQGHAYEQRAVNYLQQQGLIILEQNISSRFGEIDIVAHHPQGDLLIFLEVRQRSQRTHGGALYSVQRDKQLRIQRTARFHLSRLSQQHFNNRTPFCRFDVLAIENDTITWIPNAFE